MCGLQVDQSVSSLLTIAGLGTYYSKRLKIKGIVGREKIVFVLCFRCGHRWNFAAWDLKEAQEKANSCPNCASTLSSKNVLVF